MARPQSTAGARARKNRRIEPTSKTLAESSRRAGATHAQPYPGGNGDAAASLEQAIEFERGRLSNAQSILGCLHAALLSAEERNQPEPGCADVAAMALRLVREAVHRLDYIHLKPLIETLRDARRANRRRARAVESEQHGR